MIKNELKNNIFILKMLSGNKYVDICILMFLDDHTLFNACMTCKYINGLCDQNFWRNKFAYKYKLDNLKDELYLFDDYTWKKLYIQIKFNNYEILHKAYQYKLAYLCIFIFKHTEIEYIEEEIISSASYPSFMELVYLVFNDKELINKLNLTEIFRMSCDLRENNIKKKEQLELFNLLLEAGLHIEGYDLSCAIEGENSEIVKKILFLNVLSKQEIIKFSKIFDVDDYFEILELIKLYLNKNV
ncbi:hypothetical protein MEO93_28245 [Dolichospermum sp. ST_sed3]|nr:hypothetical protein [Dolichospermum sp. ST_sed3]